MQIFKGLANTRQIIKFRYKLNYADKELPGLQKLRNKQLVNIKYKKTKNISKHNRKYKHQNSYKAEQK